MTEREWQSFVVDLAGSSGWWTYHTFDSRRSTAGFPDLVLVRGGELIFAELKRDGGRPTPEQLAVLLMLRGAGQTAVVWTPADEAEVVARLTGRRIPAIDATS